MQIQLAEVYMFGKKKMTPSLQFDKDHYHAVLKCSICTGEQVAGFKEISTGKFHEIQLIRTANDLDEFRKMYGVDEITKEY